LPPPDARPARTATSELAIAFTRFAADRCGSYAPLYAHLASRIAGDRELLAIAAHARPGQSQPDLMLAAVHYLLARQPRSPLARYYPTLNPDPVPPGDAFPEFRHFCLAHRDELAALTGSRLVQTNEVRRCCYLLPAVTLAVPLAAPVPLALIEAGASAGLNLGLDGYAYDYGTGTITGAPRSPLMLHCELRGGTPPPLALPAPDIAWRAGIDLSPLDPLDPDDAAWLRALVWADHPGRARLLDRALRAAVRPPAPVHPGDATALLPALVASAPADAAICVMHTAFLAHLAPPDRARFEHQVAALSAGRPVYWISAETRADPGRTAPAPGHLRERNHHQPAGARPLPVARRMARMDSAKPAPAGFRGVTVRRPGCRFPAPRPRPPLWRPGTMRPAGPAAASPAPRPRLWERTRTRQAPRPRARSP
jgi:hypothetical protein